MIEKAGSDWSQRPRPVITGPNPEGQVVDQVTGLFTAAHLVVAVVYEPPTIPLHAERQLQPIHWLAALAEPFTSSLNTGLAVPMPTFHSEEMRIRKVDATLQEALVMKSRCCPAAVSVKSCAATPFTTAPPPLKAVAPYPRDTKTPRSSPAAGAVGEAAVPHARLATKAEPLLFQVSYRSSNTPKPVETDPETWIFAVGDCVPIPMWLPDDAVIAEVRNPIS